MRAPTKDRTMRGIALFLVCVAMNLLGWWGVGLGSTPTFGWAAFQKGAIVGTFAWVGLLVITVLLLRGRSTSLRNVILVALASLPTILAGGRVAELLNATLDSSAPHAAPASVVLRSRGKGGPNREVTLHATNDKANVSAPHTNAVMFTYTPQNVEATIRDGALGSPWLVQLRAKP